MKVLFWAAFGLIVYTWLVYPVILAVLARLWGRPEAASQQARAEFPLVTLLITVHDGEAHIARKLENSLAIDYPRERLAVVVASDGSTDGTDDIVAGYADRGVELVRISPQRGKTAAQNAALDRCRGDLVFFTNVQTSIRPDALRRLVVHFADPGVGGVAPLLVWTGTDASDISRGGAIYWRYEQMMWRWEARLGLLACAPGACMIVRRDLVKPMPECYGEDVILPLWVAGGGRRFVYEPRAEALEPRASSPGEEYAARVRMTTRSFGATVAVWPARLWARFPALTWAILSHKIMRWSTPFFMLMLFGSNLALVSIWFCRITVLLQISFYGLAILGLLSTKPSNRKSLSGIAYGFCLINTAFAIGVLRTVVGQRVHIFCSRE